MLFKSKEDYETGKLLSSHGMTTLSYERSKGHSSDYDVVGLGYNYRIDDIRASLALEQIKKIPEDYKKRKKVRETYMELLSGVDNLTIPFIDRTDYASNYIFPIIVANCDRNAVRSYLQSNGIQTSMHYPAVHRFSIYKDFSVSLPKTEHVADNLITLPMYGDLTNAEIEYVCQSLIEALVD